MDLSPYQPATPARPPREGEQTGSQSLLGYYTLPAAVSGDYTAWPSAPASGRELWGGLGRTAAGVCGGWSGAGTDGNVYGLTGYGEAPPLSYAMLRKVGRHPTLALAAGVVVAPVIAAGWSYEKKKGIPDERVDFVRETFKDARSFLLSQMGRGLGFGHRTFELVYEQRTFANRRLLTVGKFKPLRPERTVLLSDRRTGVLSGVKQDEVELAADKVLHYGYDVEDDDHRGQSRHLNVYDEAWWPWVRTAQSGGRLDEKISGIIPIIKFPPGKGQDAAGNDVDNLKLAMALIAGLARQRGIAMENLAGVIDDPRMAGEFAKMSLWDVDFYDAGEAASAAGSFIDKLRYLDSLMMRGWLLPERSALEGQFGTKAEAGVHGDIGVTGSEQLHAEMVRCVNRHVVDRLLALNYGEEARGSVWIEPGPLVDESKEFFRTVFELMLANPQVLSQLVNQIDVDALADRLSVPKKDGKMIDLEIPAAAPPVPGQQPPIDGQVKPPAKPNPFAGANGNGRAIAMSRGLELLGKVWGDDDGEPSSAA